MKIAVGLACVLASAAPGAWRAQMHDAPAALSPTDELDQTLRESFELLDDGDLPAALRAMQRAVVRASEEDLRRLSEKALRVRGIPLDELLADTRLRVARGPSRNRTFEVRYATPFEGEALGRRLEALTDEFLRTEFAGKSVAQWSRDPSAYGELRSDSPDLEFRARMAAGFIGARLRWDPRVRATAGRPTATQAASDRRAASTPLSRGDLIRLRDDLARLAAHVRALPGFTQPSAARYDPDDPTLREAQRLEAEQEALEEAQRPAEDHPPADSQPASRPAGP